MGDQMQDKLASELEALLAMTMWRKNWARKSDFCCLKSFYVSKKTCDFAFLSSLQEFGRVAA